MNDWTYLGSFERIAVELAEHHSYSTAYSDAFAVAAAELVERVVEADNANRQLVVGVGVVQLVERRHGMFAEVAFGFLSLGGS